MMLGTTIPHSERLAREGVKLQQITLIPWNQNLQP
jgi:hypothetical protein